MKKVSHLRGADRTDHMLPPPGGSWGHGDDVRLDAIVHVRHERTGTAPTGLYPSSSSRMPFRRRIAQSLQEFWSLIDARRLALNRPDHDADGVRYRPP